MCILASSIMIQKSILEQLYFMCLYQYCNAPLLSYKVNAKSFHTVDKVKDCSTDLHWKIFEN